MKGNNFNSTASAWNFVRYVEGVNPIESDHLLHASHLLEKTLGREAVENTKLGQARYPHSTLEFPDVPRRARPLILSLLDKKQQTEFLFPQATNLGEPEAAAYVLQNNSRLARSHEVEFSNLSVLNFTHNPNGKKFVVVKFSASDGDVFKRDTQCIIDSLSEYTGVKPFPLQQRRPDVTLSYIHPGYSDDLVYKIVGKIAAEIVPFRAIMEPVVATSQGR